MTVIKISDLITAPHRVSWPTCDYTIRFPGDPIPRIIHAPARPYPDTRYRPRLRAAWLVLTGRADALLWE